MKLNLFPFWALTLILLLVLTACGGDSGGDTDTGRGGDLATYAVTYDGNGSDGGGVPVDPGDYQEGQLVTVIGNVENLTNTGASFVGWNTEMDGSGDGYVEGDQFAMGTADVTLYAQWSANPGYAVTYDSNAGDSGSAPIDSNRYEEGQYVTVLGNPGDLVRSGFSLTGWNTQADASGSGYAQGDQFTMGSADVTLYAQWSSNPTYSVTYDGNGSASGSVPVDSLRHEAGRTVTVLGNSGDLAIAGYSFTGWNTAADGGGSSYAQGNQFTMEASDITLYAQWSLNPAWSVSYDGNGADSGGVPIDSNRYEQGWSIMVMGNINNLAHSGYTFSGWNTQADGSGTGYVPGNQFVMDASDIILYAQWNLKPTYTVTYDGNGNSGGNVPIDSTHYEAGALVTVLGNPNNLTQEGYTFTGWSIQVDGNGTGYVEGDQFAMGTADVTLYAKWSANPTFTVTYFGNANDGGSVPIDTTEYEQGVAVTVLGNSGNLTQSGSTFSGWNTAADGSGTGYAPGNQFDMGVTDVSLYAQWTLNPTYTVTYDGNGSDGGSVPVDTTHYEQGDSVTVLGNSGSLTRTDYAFTGWNTQADGGGTGYTQGQIFSMITEEITLYAQWTYHPTYTVTYLSNGAASGSVPIDTTHYEAGQTVTVLGNTGNLAPSNGQVFYGWTRPATGSFVYYHGGDTFVIGTANEALTAAWAYPDTITLIYDGNENTGGDVPAPPTEYNDGIWVMAAENSGNLVRTGYTFGGWYGISASWTGTQIHSFEPGEYFLMSTMLPGYSALDDAVTLYAKWIPKATLLYNAGTHNGDFGGLDGANAICEDNMPAACGARTKVHAFMGEWSQLSLDEIPGLIGIDATLPIVGPNGLQISADWSVLEYHIDKSDMVDIDNSLADAGVMPADSRWWSGYGYNNNNLMGPSMSCMSKDTFATWSSSDVEMSGSAGTSSTTTSPDWVDVHTVIEYSYGTYRDWPKCNNQFYLLCVCGE